MKQKLKLLLTLFFFNATFAWAADDPKPTYKYKIDLNAVHDDMLDVELEVPEEFGKDELTFHFPKIVPGTYEILDFGRFVNGLKAFDSKGNELKIDRKDPNTWVIKKAKKITRITYTIKDTWDENLRKAVFEPSGSSFEAGKAFVLNGNACFGFFKGQEKNPYEITFDRPNEFYGTTSLRRLQGDFDSDIFHALTYDELVDAPIMYCVPDTMNFKLGFGDIQISVYSPNKETTAKEIGECIRPILEAQAHYLGNILPVDKYAFILYLSPDGYASGGVGALEHARSSMFCLTEEKVEKISKLIIDIASHEFFHIVTPLYIRSEEIYYFDFMEPKMSKHLWLYEGVVEYMAQHMQAKYNLISDDDFMDVLGDKVRSSKRYKQDLSLSELSMRCLEPDYVRQYNNIYFKGAMIAACLDLKLLTLSDGEYDLQILLKDLSSYFGQDDPFKDEILYQKIIDITEFEELNEFFEKYVEKAEPIPYNKFLEPFGIEYQAETKIKEVSPLGGLERGVLKTDSLDRFYIAKYERLDEFGNDYIKFKPDDVILKWAGKKLTIKNVTGVLITYMNNIEEGDPLEIEILRKQEDGSYKEMTLSTELVKIDIDKKHVFVIKEDATAEQIRMRNKWLEPKEQ
ncbi:MAG: peptidase M61 [Saprospiraceae bacterium]|nr:peptidase M61 [Saprospiraceae bacterium]